MSRVGRWASGALLAVVSACSSTFADGQAVLAELDRAGVLACEEIRESAAGLWVCRTGVDTAAAIVDRRPALEDFIATRRQADHEGPWVLGPGWVVELPGTLAGLAPRVAEEIGGEIVGEIT